LTGIGALGSIWLESGRRCIRCTKRLTIFERKRKMTSGKKSILYCLVVLSCVALVACGKKVDENKPVSEVKAEAEKMNIEQLRATALKYKEAILAKKEELEKVSAQFTKIPATKMLGEEAKQVMAEIEDLNKSVSALKERFEVYYKKLKEMGGDSSGLEL